MHEGDPLWGYSDGELLTYIIDLDRQRKTALQEAEDLLQDQAEAILHAKKNRPGLRMTVIAQRLGVSRQRVYQLAYTKEN